MGSSVKLKMYTRDVRKDGNCGIYLQVLINIRKLDLGLDLQWLPNKFDEKSGCKPRFKGDKLAADYNLIIGNARTKANDIFVFYRVRDLPIDVDIFRREFYSNMNKNNFIEYFRQKSLERYSKGLISLRTHLQEKTTINKLVAFSDGVIPFNSFHAMWGREFDLFIRRKYNNDQNTCWSERKRVKTYLTMATDDGIAYIDPYKKFKVKPKKSRFQALTKTEFQKLFAYYVSSTISKEDKILLRRFLFSCCTGLRIGDLRRLHISNFSNGTMSITPNKTKRYATVIDAAPLNDIALMLLDEEISISTDGRLFYRYTEQYGNRRLKIICNNAGLNRSVKNHEGRSTFASLYDQAGGNHRSLMELMGLTKPETLFKYVHTNKEIIREGVSKLNESLKDSSGYKASIDLISS